MAEISSSATLATRNSGLLPLAPRLEETSGDLREIDPFTFFSSFNRGITDENRLAILSALKKHWALSAELPLKFDGLPIMDNRSAWFIRFAKDRGQNDVAARWILAEAVLKAKSPNDVPAKLIDDCLSPSKGNLTSITIGMFWFNPEQFPALDWKNQSYADAAGIVWKEGENSGANYLAWVKAVRDKFGADLAAFSHAAHKAATAETNENSPQGIAAIKHIRVWALAAGEEGYLWENFHENAYAGIGWNEVGDLNKFPDQNAIEVALQTQWPSEKRKSNDSLALWEFSHEIAVGDYIVAKMTMVTPHELSGADLAIKFAADLPATLFLPCFLSLFLHFVSCSRSFINNSKHA